MTDEEFIFKLKSETNDGSIVESYTFIGYEDFTDADNCPRINKEDDNRVLAKKRIRNNGSTRYSIKLDNSNRKLFNPTIYDINAKLENKKPVFKNVNMKTFSLYINFLKSKNQSWLLNAERESE
jgi:hypothetical protein